MKRVTVDMEDPLYVRLHIQHLVTGVSMADIVRRLLDRELPPIDALRKEI